MHKYITRCYNLPHTSYRNSHLRNRKTKNNAKISEDPMWGGHTGQKKLLNKIKNYYSWKNLAKDVASYVKNCPKCMLNKVKSGTREELMLTTIPQRALDVMIADTVGPIAQKSNNNTYIITLICELTKYLVNQYQ